MLALRKTRPAPGLSLEEIEEPRLASSRDVIVEVAAAGICGTDLHIDHWSRSHHHLAAALPLTMGHEFCGRVVAKGAAAGLALGARVTVVPATSCGRCDACAKGDRDGCPERKGIGILRDGGFARFAAVPAENCIPVPDGLPDELAALTEPMAIGANAVAAGGIGKGDRVLIFGPGTIGQAIAIFARRAGAADIAIVGWDDALRFAVLRALGFHTLIDVADEGGAARLAALRDGADCVFEASGATQAFEDGFAATAPGGRMVVVGVHAAPAALDLLRLVRKRIRLIGAFSSPAAIWPGVVAAIAAEPGLFAQLITHRLPLAEALAGFAAAAQRRASKVMLLPG